MATGDFLVRRNASDTSTIPDTGGLLDTWWDTEVAVNGTSITYPGPGSFQLADTGHYLVMYSDQYGTTDTTNNERLNVFYRLVLNGSAIEAGRSSGYIRKNSGSQEFITAGAAIIDVTVSNTVLSLRAERTDNTAVAGREPDRIANDRSGITILKLDDSWGYGLYSLGTDQNIAATEGSWIDVTLDTTDEEDSPFTRTGNDVDIATTNLCLVCYTIPMDYTASGGTRQEYQSGLELAGSMLVGMGDQTYIRGTDETDDGCMMGIGLIKPTSGQDLTLKYNCREGGGLSDIKAGACLQIVELPSYAEGIIVEATTGDFNGSGVNFAWDTLEYIDTDSFTHTAGNANIDVDVADDYLVFCSVRADSVTNATRAVPACGLRVNTTDIEHAGNSSYSRNSGTAEHPGLGFGTLLPALSANDSIYMRADRVGTASTACNNSSGQMSAVRLTTLFEDPAGSSMRVFIIDG